MATRTHLYANLLEKHGYGYLYETWAANKTAFIKYAPDVAGSIEADGAVNTFSVGADELLGSAPVQDWKTLWFVYAADSAQKFALVLPTKATVDMDMLATYLGTTATEMNCSLHMSEGLPALHTPGTSGPWTPIGDESIDAILVDNDSLRTSSQYALTSWAFPGIPGSKVYLPELETSLEMMYEHTKIPIRRADIAKQ